MGLSCLATVPRSPKAWHLSELHDPFQCSDLQVISFFPTARVRCQATGCFNVELGGPSWKSLELLITIKPIKITLELPWVKCIILVILVICNLGIMGFVNFERIAAANGALPRWGVVPAYFQSEDRHGCIPNAATTAHTLGFFIDPSPANFWDGCVCVIAEFP